MSAETEAMWKTLSRLALEAKQLHVAERWVGIWGLYLDCFVSPVMVQLHLMAGYFWLDVLLVQSNPLGEMTSFTSYVTASFRGVLRQGCCCQALNQGAFCMQRRQGFAAESQSHGLAVPQMLVLFHALWQGGTVFLPLSSIVMTIP